MKKMESLQEIQKVELDILRVIRSVCQKYNLVFFLAGGTLLGAVRHNGFIPWDNDMDISMPRPDYDKLISNFDDEMELQKLPYRVHRLTNSGQYCCPFIKIVDTRTMIMSGENQKFKGKDMGIFVDIFPIDGLPDQKDVYIREFFAIREKCIRIALSFARFGNLNFKEKLKLCTYKFLYGSRDRERLLDLLQNRLRRYSFYESRFIVSTFGLRKKKEIIEFKHFSKTVMLSFEGEQYPAPVGYKEYLTQMYGDYMQLPPENERVVPHNFEVYWMEE